MRGELEISSFYLARIFTLSDSHTNRQCLGGLLVPPLFRILRESVTQTPLALDATPTSTPRRDSMSESNTGSGGT